MNKLAEETEKSVIAIDCDGVHVDWFRQYLKSINHVLGTRFKYEHCVDFDFPQFFELSDKQVHDIDEHFLRHNSPSHLPPVAGAIEATSLLASEYEIVIITSRPDRHRYIDATYHWYQVVHNFHFPIYFSQGAGNRWAGGVGRKSKLQIAEEIGAIAIIEDNPYELAEFSGSDVKAICFAQPWNWMIPDEDRFDWDSILRYFLPSPPTT